MTWRLVGFLARRIDFTPGAKVAMAALTAVVTVMTALAITLNALTLSSAQVAERDFGRFQHRLQVALPLGDRMDPDLLARLGEAARAAGASEAAVSVTSFELRLDQRDADTSQGPVTIASYLEGPGVRSDFPGRYQLIDGRWPETPREIALTPTLKDSLTSDQELTLLGVPVTPVGTYVDVFDHQRQEVLAGSGTYSSLPAETLKRKRRGAEGSATIHWSGAEDGAVEAAVLALNPGTFRPQALKLSRLDRSSVETETAPSLVDDNSLAFSLPSQLLAALIAGLIAVLSAPRLEQHVTAGLGIGVRRRVFVLAHLARSGAGVVFAVIGGALLGLALGALARIPLAPVAEQPLSPIRLQVDAVPSLLLAALGGLMALAVVRSLPARRRSARRTPRLPWALMRRAAAACLLLFTLPQISYRLNEALLTGFAAAVVAAFLLLVPDAVAVTTRALSPRRVTTLLVRRAGSADRGRAALIALLIAVGLVVPFLLGTFTASRLATEQAELVPEAAPSSIVIAHGNQTARITDEAVGIVSRTTGTTPVTMTDVARSVASDGSAVEVKVEGTPSWGATHFAIVEDVPALEELLGLRLSMTDRQRMEDGAVAVPDKAYADTVGYLHSPLRGAQPPEPAGTLPAVHLDIDRSTTQYSAGIVLRSTADELGWRGRPRYEVYRGLDTQQLDSAESAVEAAGLSSDILDRFEPPRRLELPTNWFVALVVLAIVSAAAIGATASAQARQLRRHAGLMMAIGLRRSWPFRVLLVQLGVALTVGLAVSIPAAGIPMWRWSASNDQLRFDVPVGFVGVSCACAAAALVMGSVVGLFRLRASEASSDY